MRSLWLFCLVPAAVAQTAPFTADSARGQDLFRSLSCVQCHSINGSGGAIAPDLGKLVDRNFTPAALCAAMWNHAPAMWSAIRKAATPPRAMDAQAAADLFAYFYSTRYFEKPGDAARGKRIFNTRGCSGCHGLDQELQPGIPPVSRWEDLNRPFGLTEQMWNHMPRMLAATSGGRTPWPYLSGQDLADLLVYLRNLPETRGKPAGLAVTTGAKGLELFQSKGCAGCHESGTALAVRIKGRTVTEIAAQMWDHAPKMRAAGARTAEFRPGEMSELLSYLWARQFFEDSGDPARGARVFVAKRCAGCHTTGHAPDLTAGDAVFSGPAMISALWRHGPAMLDEMKAHGIPWPRLDAADMSGLIAYLNHKKKERR
ncbi:MAG TPA: c-type cytochrome [Bryobacteraceae bacterium]|jgi:mono/diheme cytochrome c family protein|nr:c-type cytochrome [Bryobacteraceae bacterium]